MSSRKMRHREFREELDQSVICQTPIKTLHDKSLSLFKSFISQSEPIIFKAKINKMAMVYVIPEVTGSIIIDRVTTKIFICFENFIKTPTHQPGIIKLVSDRVSKGVKLIPKIQFFLIFITDINNTKSQLE